jgi:hypothetical protein
MGGPIFSGRLFYFDARIRDEAVRNISRFLPFRHPSTAA